MQNFREKDMCSTFMPASLLLLRVTSTCPPAKVRRTFSYHHITMSPSIPL